MEVSIPVCSVIVFSHLAMVLNVTALWGLVIDMNNLVSSPSSGLVLSRYVLRVFTGHNTVFGIKDGTKNSSIGLP